MVGGQGGWCLFGAVPKEKRKCREKGRSESESEVDALERWGGMNYRQSEETEKSLFDR